MKWQWRRITHSEYCSSTAGRIIAMVCTSVNSYHRADICSSHWQVQTTTPPLTIRRCCRRPTASVSGLQKRVLHIAAVLLLLLLSPLFKAFTTHHHALRGRGFRRIVSTGCTLNWLRCIHSEIIAYLKNQMRRSWLVGRIHHYAPFIIHHHNSVQTSNDIKERGRQTDRQTVILI